MNTKSIFSTAACVVMLSGSASFGATLTLNNEGSDSFGSPDFSETVTRVILANPNGGNSGTSTLSAGMFRFVDAADAAMTAILAFCLEPGKGLTIGSPFSTTDAPNISAARLAAVESLFSTSYSLVNNASTAAAFQLAIWEIAAETDAGPYDLTGGNHSITASLGTTASTAQDFLDGLGGAATGSYSFTTYTNNGQDLISAAPSAVPIPASGLMIMTALGGLAAIGRRRRKS